MTEDVAADEEDGPGDQAVEEIENSHRANAHEVKQCALDAKVRGGLMRALLDSVSAPAIGVCLHAGPSRLELVVGCGFDFGSSHYSDAPKPAQDVGGKHGDSRTGCHTCQRLLRPR